MRTAKIADLSVYLPERVVPNCVLEKRLALPGQSVPENVLERLFGVRERRFAAPGEQVSDLAAQAAHPLVKRWGAGKIDFLIFAAACADLIEPATANIVQHKLGLQCPAMDVKNACNSFTTGLLTASSLIAAGHCTRVLVVNGEKLSDAIRTEFDDEAQLCRHLAAFSLGDAGAAALVAASGDGSGFQYQRFLTRGEHWPLCTIPGGGSLFPHDVEKTFFEGQTSGLKDVMAVNGAPFFHQCLAEAGWAPADVQHLITHQVSAQSTRLISRMTQVPPERIEEIYPDCGNTAAAAIPLALHRRWQRGAIRPGDRVALLGLAAGLSVSVQLMVW